MKKSRIFFITLIAIFVWLAMAALLWANMLDNWQERIFDAFFHAKNPAAPSEATNNIVIFSIDNESISQIGQWPWKRDVFARAIGKLQPAKAIGIDVNFSEATPEDAVLAAAMKASKPAIILPLQLNATTQELVEPVGILKDATLQGFVNISIDSDGTARKTNPQGSFSSVLASQLNGVLAIPGNIRIDYAGPEKTVLTLPINDLLNDKIPPRIFQDKIVIIGATAADLHDYFQTPFGLISGAEINANIAATLLGRHFYQNTSFLVSVFVLLLIVLACTLAIVKLRKFYVLLPALALVFITINLVSGLLFTQKIVFPVLYANLAWLSAAAMVMLFQYAVESKEKRFIYQSFKQYLSSELIDQLIDDPSKLKLGGERKKVAILFSDIRGFTQIAETMPAEELVSVMNDYFHAMSGIIMDSRGLIEKYIGDAIVAFWGAPVENPNQTQDACHAALAMVDAIENLNQMWAKKGAVRNFSIGVGINSGEVIVGNMGSAKRFNYGMVGDNVNFTSRLEGLNKTYGTNIIISEGAKKDIEHLPGFFIRDLDMVIVKGKREPRHIFELLTKPLKPEVAKHFAQGKEYYQKGDWKNAIKCFALIATIDGPSQAFLDRCQIFLKNPPENWNGIYEFTSK